MGSANPDLNSKFYQNTWSLLSGGKKPAHKDLKGCLEVPNISLNEIFEEHGEVEFLCIDVEGWDLEVVSSLNLSLYRPKLVCVETKNPGVRSKIVQSDFVFVEDWNGNDIFVAKESEWLFNIFPSRRLATHSLSV